MNEEILSQFRTKRYELLNDCRWNHFEGMGIKIHNKTVLELGAGVGDQTEWLLAKSVKHVTVIEGRNGNLEIIKERFGETNPRITYCLGNLETCLSDYIDRLFVDLIYFYGVYYHVNETFDFPIMRQLSKLGTTIAMDYLVGRNQTEDYGYDNPSTSISQHGIRVEQETLMTALKNIWGYAYVPDPQLEWKDPQNGSEHRLVAVASHSSIESPTLKLWE